MSAETITHIPQDASEPIDEVAPTMPSPGARADVLLCLPALAPEALDVTLRTIAAAFPGEQILIASPDADPDAPSPVDGSAPAAAQNAAQPNAAQPRWISYSTARAGLGWVLAASDYAAAARVASEHDARAVLLLGREATALDALHLRGLADCIRTRNVDLAVPRFHPGPSDGLVNAAILYPLTRSLFTSDIHSPLPVDAAMSQRLAARIATPAQHLNALHQGDALFWPVAEAAIAGFSVREVDAGSTSPPPPPTGDFNALFSSVVGYLFGDIDAKATFWQRARSQPARAAASGAIFAPAAPSDELKAEIAGMIESFHLAQSNLQELWSIVLPPQSRLALKKLSAASPDDFVLEPALWARIVYDFALAYHLRSLNRGHLLGAMAPLYLAWVASHLRASADSPERSARHVEETAAAFEQEKSYIVARWRWPDRFNP
jgi:hypothetical protein